MQDGVVARRGWVVFGDVKVYDDREAFEGDEALHMVQKDSGYAWKESTKRVYGWVVKEAGSFIEGGLAKAAADGDSFVLVRRMRSLFEIEERSALGGGNKGKAKGKGKGKKKGGGGGGGEGGKKKRRF